MGKCKLILLDLDGTLLDGDSKVPSNFDDVVNKLAEKGIKIGIASGRNFSSMKFLFPKSYDKMVGITCNGSNIYVDGKEIFHEKFKPESIKKIITITKSLNEAYEQLLIPEGMICEVNDGGYKELFNLHGYKALSTDTIEDYFNDIVMIAVHSNNYPNGFVDKYESLKDEVKFSASWHNCIDFMPKGVSKGAGTKIVCDYLNISIDNVMAIGDQDNDLEILKTVGMPVAMLNGNANVKSIAKDITSKTNLENGALEYIVDKLIKV